MMAPPFVRHSTMALHFCGGPGFLHKHSQLWVFSLPSFQAISPQLTSVLSPGLLSKPHIPAPSPRLHPQTHLPGSGEQGCGKDHLCRSHSVLPATDRLLCSLLITPEAPLLSQLISPPVRVLPWMWEPPLFFSSPPGSQVLSHFLSSSFFLFFLSSYLFMWGSFFSFSVSKVLC